MGPGAPEEAPRRVGQRPRCRVPDLLAGSPQSRLALEEWLRKAESGGAPPLRRFAASLEKDLAAVEAGLTLRWNNGPVEGFVHKLKLVKRQGYGRANLDLLRARALAA